ncbi:shikimate kinase [Rubrivirga sp.]|uniref:shikimate kinase n=1 Tax=Rubrivirga sp. TaxID=1885344 RepID=UPI003C763CA3
MTRPRVLILGNSGSGKTTMARALAELHGVDHLDLDLVAFSEPGVRADFEDSAAAIRAFDLEADGWVIEGSYASLAEVASPLATEFVFLNPGVETCIAHARARPWEPEKYDSKADQDAGLEFLLDWIRSYPGRDDDYGQTAHRTVFDAFTGDKREVTSSDLEG